MAVADGTRRVRPPSKLPVVSQPWGRSVDDELTSLRATVRELETRQQAMAKNIESVLGVVQVINARLTALED